MTGGPTPDGPAARPPRRSGPDAPRRSRPETLWRDRGFSAALLTWAAAHIGATSTCLASGAACLLLGAVAFFTPVRQPAPEPGAAAA
ncbi:MAG TPA: hypothetical protein VMV92_33120 [Streptosporangiaceae bacterium]|nr:hypothetical protein [Streptosporangiaceae bacterium]